MLCNAKEERGGSRFVTLHIVIYGFRTKFVIGGKRGREQRGGKEGGVTAKNGL